MATILREVLNNNGMILQLACGGMSKAGIGVSGNWTGTLNFFFSTDGLNWQYNPLFTLAFPAGSPVGTGQKSTTINGNFETLVKNYATIVCQINLLSGAPVVAMAAALDSSYQDAFLVSTSKFVTQASGAGASNTIVQSAQGNRAWRLRTLSIGFSAAPANPVLVQVQDGASSIIWQGYATTGTAAGESAGTWVAPLPLDAGNLGLAGGGVVGTPGNSMSVIVAGGGGSVITTPNCEFYAA